jgi:hypothetical protein
MRRDVLCIISQSDIESGYMTSSRPRSSYSMGHRLTYLLRDNEGRSKSQSLRKADPPIA